MGLIPLQKVTLYIRTNRAGKRRYERVRSRNPQVCGPKDSCRRYRHARLKAEVC